MYFSAQADTHAVSLLPNEVVGLETQLLKHVPFILSMRALALAMAYWSRINCISLIFKSWLDVGSESGDELGELSAVSLDLEEEKEEKIDDIMPMVD